MAGRISVRGMRRVYDNDFHFQHRRHKYLKDHPGLPFAEDELLSASYA